MSTEMVLHVWRILKCQMRLVVFNCRCWLPPLGISALHVLQTASFTSFSETMRKFQTGELMLPVSASFMWAEKQSQTIYVTLKNNSIDRSIPSRMHGDAITLH